MEKGQLLLKDVQAEKTTTTMGIFKRPSPVNVLKGELLVAIPGEDIVFRIDGKPAHNFRLAKDPSVTLHAGMDDVAPLNDYDFQLLDAIDSCHARFESFSVGKLEWAQSLKPGSNVYIGLSPSRIRVSATVHFIGDVPIKQGLLFGVEIMDKNYRGQGETDGTFQGKRYFRCEDNCGLFLPLDRVWQDAWEDNIGGSAQNTRSQIQATPSGRSTGSSVDCPQFRLGDRVVVYNKIGLGIHGTVGWTGKNPSFPNSHIIGVETDVPVNKRDFEDALPGLSQNMKVKDSRHGKVFLPEPFVASEEEAAGKRVQPSRVLPPHDQHPPCSAEQEEALRKVGEDKEAKRIEELRKAFLDQQRVLREIERKNEERRAALQQRAGAQQNPPAPGYFIRSDPHNPTQPPAHPLHLPSQHPVQFGGSHIAQRPYKRQPSQSCYEEVPDQQYQPRNVDAGDRIYNRLNRRGYEIVSDQQPPSQPGQVPGQFQQQPISQQPPQVPPRTHLSHPLNQPPAQAWSTPPSDPLGATKPVAYATPRQGSARPYPDLGIGSTVQVSDPPRYGVVRWIGPLPEVQGLIVGVELEDHMEGCTDGTWRGVRYFTCVPGRGFFCPYFKLAPDQRFGETGSTPGARTIPNPLSDRPMVEVADQYIENGQVDKYLGEGRGIQGHQNSCYLDATVFGLFALSDVFDSMFLEHTTDPTRQEINGMLWKGIVNPLRKNGVVRFESVMTLRNKLEELGKIKGITHKEKDPEEFLNLLFKHTLHVEPFISIRRPFGVEQEYFVQLFLEPDETVKLPPSVGDLLKKMFKEQNISFTQVPSKLLIQVPRYGKQFKRIVPELRLDVMDFTDSPYTCSICASHAWNACQECSVEFIPGGRVKESTYFCDDCASSMHKHPQRAKHSFEKACNPEDVSLELLSVICIETSHYVCFARSEERWIFSDSMANRVYDMYNIPQGVECTRELNEWVYSGDHRRLLETPPRELPELVRRFTQDIYMCVYIQPDVGMYGDEGDEGDASVYYTNYERTGDLPELPQTLATEIEQLKKEKDELKQSKEQLQRQYSNLQNQNEETTQAKLRLQQEKQQAQAQCSRLEQGILQLRDGYSRLQQDAVKTHELYQGKQQECSKLQQELSQTAHQFHQQNVHIQQQVQEATQAVFEKQQLQEQCHSQLQRLDQQSQHLTLQNQQLQRLEQQNQHLQRECSRLEREKEEADRAREQLQQQIASDQQRDDGAHTRIHTLRQLSQDVVLMNVPRGEVEIRKEIGRGAWGCVAEGKFHGQKVAVKWPHEEIATPETIGRLHREVQIMAQVRHPNLLRLIAIVFDHQLPPLLVMELLEMNLRRAYQSKRLVGSSTIPIFRDVAYALHYLHKHEEPIIHRDVSAPNVLLEALPNGLWRAKVSDFGSANLAKRARTAAEGAIVYAAPETFPGPYYDRKHQTLKIDVYSYGILLCEVITSRLPDPDHRARMLQQVRESQFSFMHDLIVSCVSYNIDERPTMGQVIDELYKFPQPGPRQRPQ